MFIACFREPTSRDFLWLLLYWLDSRSARSNVNFCFWNSVSWGSSKSSFQTLAFELVLLSWLKCVWVYIGSKFPYAIVLSMEDALTNLQPSHWSFNNKCKQVKYISLEYQNQCLNNDIPGKWLKMMMVTPGGAWCENWQRKSL